MAIDLGTAMAFLMLDTSGFERGFKTAADTMGGFQSSAGGLVSSIDNISTGLENTGRSLSTKVSLPLVAIGKDAIQTGMEFEQSMANVKAISGATGSEFESLQEKAREMGAKTKYTASEAADAMSYMAMAGWKTRDMLNGIEGIMNLAAASGEDLATTSDIVTDALTAFGLTAQDSAHFADILAAASSNANTNVGMMGETFKYVAPVAGALGYSAEDTALAVGLMANSGIKASQAGTSLRGALTRLANPTDTMVGAMVQLGLATQEYVNVVDEEKVYKATNKLLNAQGNLTKVQIDYNNAVEKYGEGSEQVQKKLIDLEKAQRSVEAAEHDLSVAQQGAMKQGETHINVITDENGQMRSLEEVIMLLREKFQGLTEDQQAQYASVIFGQNAMSGMLALINATDGDVQKLSGAIEGCTDSTTGYSAANEMAEIQMDTTEGKLLEMQSALSDLKIEIFQSVKPALDIVIELIRDLANFLSGLTDEQKESIIKFVGMVAAIGPVILIIGEVVSVVGTVMKVFGTLGKAIKLIGALFTALGAGPVAAIVAAIAAVVGIVIVLYNKFEWFRNLVNGIWEGIKKGIDLAIQAIKDFIGIFESAKSSVNGTAGQAVFTRSVSALRGSHANGLDYVPYDGYVAELHRGERVLTKNENERYSNRAGSGGDTFNFYAVQATPYEYAREMKRAKAEILGGM